MVADNGGATIAVRSTPSKYPTASVEGGECTDIHYDGAQSTEPGNQQEEEQPICKEHQNIHDYANDIQSSGLKGIGSIIESLLKISTLLDELGELRAKRQDLALQLLHLCADRFKETERPHKVSGEPVKASVYDSRATIPNLAGDHPENLINEFNTCASNT